MVGTRGVRRVCKELIVAKRKRARRGLAGVSTQELELELKRRRAGVVAMERRRNRLLRRLAEIERRITHAVGVVGGRAAAAIRGRRGPWRPRGQRRRPKNTRSLVQALADLLKGRTMSVSEAAVAVRKAGYRTTSPNFRTIVNQTLLKGDQFRKVSRGKYTAR